MAPIQKSSFSKLRSLIASILIMVGLPEGLEAQTTYCDNFNDGNDTSPLPAWMHYDHWRYCQMGEARGASLAVTRIVSRPLSRLISAITVRHESGVSGPRITPIFMYRWM